MIAPLQLLQQRRVSDRCCSAATVHLNATGGGRCNSTYISCNNSAAGSVATERQAVSRYTAVQHTATGRGAVNRHGATFCFRTAQRSIQRGDGRTHKQTNTDARGADPPQAKTHARTHAHTHTHTHAHTHARTRTHARTHTHTHTRTQRHTPTSKQTQANTHTHTSKQTRRQAGTRCSWRRS
jgi:hypothetical protein